jgi:tetratricopeptide (TPR) repeat protein/tRNA A-37 threonylcarbamoyl transferase component Bud32
MTEAQTPGDENGPGSSDQRIDAPSNAFDAAWRAGRAPRIEDHLADADESDRLPLFRELLRRELELRRNRGDHPGIDEYLTRFPGYVEHVHGAFGASGPQGGPAAERHRNAARNLLLGLLALQNNFIGREALLGAFAAWIADKTRPLGRILRDQGALDDARQALLEMLVGEHMKLHDDDPDKSLAALSSIGPVRRDFERVDDHDIQASLNLVGSAGIGVDDPFKTVLPPRTISARRSRFRVLRPHARGGLGEVFVARDEELNREVALKEIQDRFADDVASRAQFVAEAEITGSLEHPGIVPVYGLGHYDDGRPYYAMRFIKGDSLKEAIEVFHLADREPGRDPGERALALRRLLQRFIDVCDAIAYAHSRNVLHRDLKPGNIMLGRYGETLVVDWGLAKPLGHREGPSSEAEGSLRLSSASGSNVTEYGQAKGTPAYMSPEQAAGRIDELGLASDVYGLGATLYCLLAGQAPFAGLEIFDVVRRVQVGDFLQPTQVNPSVQPALNAVCLKAMALKPGDRYSSASALAEDVERWVADEPVSAWREPFAERARRWTRRNRTAVAAVVTALFVGLVGLAGIAVVLSERNIALDTQRRRAEDREAQAIDAVKKFRDAVANEPELKNTPALDSLRKRLLKEPLAFFRALRDQLQADHETRAESLARLAQAGFDLGGLIDEIGDKQDALIAHQEALAVRKRLADTNPAVTEFQSDLAASHDKIGTLLKDTGNPTEGLKAYESALAIRQKLADANPAVTELQKDLASSHNNIGLVLSDTGNTTEALTAYESALAIRQKLADANPTVTKFQNDLAASHNNIGVLLSETGKMSEALTAYQSASAIWRKLADANPTVTELQNVLASSHNNIGILLHRTGKPTQALTAYQSAIAIRQKLAEANPTVIKFQNDLAASHNNTGVLLSETGKMTEALTAYESALAIWQKLADANPTVTELQNFAAASHHQIGMMLSETGKTSEALTTFETALAIRQKLADANPTVTEFQSDLVASHTEIGSLLKETGKPTEALKDYKLALAIQHKLADANPTITEFQNNLAACYNNIGVMLSEMGEPTEAFRAHESALAVWQTLADANPTVTKFQNFVALSHDSLGDMLKDAGKPAEALRAYELALAIQQKLADANPSITEFQNRLATSHNAIGHLSKDTGKPVEALRAHELALAIQQKLADANPTITEFQNKLAAGHNAIGTLLKDTGKPLEALKSYESALAIWNNLVWEHPELPDYMSELGGNLDDMADIDLDAKRFEVARVRLRQSVEWQRKALSFNAANPNYRQIWEQHWKNMIRACRGLGDAAGASEAEGELAKFRDSDPANVALDARLSAIMRGDQRLTENRERLQLARRAYDKAIYATAASLWADALAADPKLVDDRQAQHRYNAACAAARAGCGQGKDKAIDDTTRSKLRAQAREWLQAEMAASTKLIDSGTAGPRTRVARTLTHWREDTELAGIRDTKALEALPDAERAAWRALWASVDALLASAQGSAGPVEKK